MARRIAAAILLTLWVMLVTGGLVAYFYTSSLLLADFDRALVDRAMSLPAVRYGPAQGTADRFPDDRYVIKNQLGQMMARPEASAATASTAVHPMVIGQDFAFATLADGQRIRRATLRIDAKTATDTSLLTIVYSSPTKPMDLILNRLAWALSISGLSAGILATYVAIRVARTALRPLRETVDVIGTIDEAHLDRRIDTKSLPPELVPVAQRLNAMLERLEQSFAQRKQFLADASHELRTPIAALLTTIEVASRRPQSEAEMSEVLLSCLGDVRLLRQLVESLMQQARSENRRLDEAYESIDVNKILREAVRVASALATRRKVVISYNESAQLLIYTQPNRLRSVIRNILNNAVEHNREHGTVEVGTEVDEGWIVIAVKDTGAGISSKHLPHLFEPFYRADNVRGEEGSHLGLGLFLVQSHLQAIGGSCQVQSDLGVGSVFKIRIPLKTSATPDMSNIHVLPSFKITERIQSNKMH